MKKYLFITLAVVLMGCATTGTQTREEGYMRIISAADAIYDTAMTTCATAYANHLIQEPGKIQCINLGGYYVQARSMAVNALATYDKTKDAADLEKVVWWVTYAEGVAANIIAEVNKIKAGA